jgi:hypothetical protein
MVVDPHADVPLGWSTLPRLREAASLEAGDSVLGHARPRFGQLQADLGGPVVLAVTAVMVAVRDAISVALFVKDQLSRSRRDGFFVRASTSRAAVVLCAGPWWAAQ